MEKELLQNLQNYIQKLDHLVDSLNNSSFPYSDAAMIYTEVSDQLKHMINE